VTNGRENSTGLFETSQEEYHAPGAGVWFSPAVIVQILVGQPNRTSYRDQRGHSESYETRRAGMIQNIPLQNIQPNPFQTRHSEDLEHIQSLAKSIQEHGLLQIPSARLFLEQMSGSGNDLYQLAFGHSRLAAYKILAGSKDIDNPQDFESMPLNIVELTDIEMFEQAVAENRECKDLSPIERIVS
jgi:hypothetical protein